VALLLAFMSMEMTLFSAGTASCIQQPSSTPKPSIDEAFSQTQSKLAVTAFGCVFSTSSSTPHYKMQ